MLPLVAEFSLLLAGGLKATGSQTASANLLKPAQLGAAISTDMRNALAALKALGPKTREAWFRLLDKISNDAQNAVVAKGVGRVFTSPDAHVGSTATQLEAIFPGRVLGVNKHLAASVPGGTREVDILMDQFIIQVKGRRATGLAGQIQHTAATLTDKSRRVIGYAPDNYSSHAWTRAANEGTPIARSFDELVEIIKELTQL